MRNLRLLQSALQVIVGSMVVVLILRTWVVLGLVLPMQVAGNSMAPTLLGEHFSTRCSNCDKAINFAAEFEPTILQITCPHCGGKSISLADSSIKVGESLAINRFTGSFRRLRRNALVVVCNPWDNSQLCVKRVLGLPGELLRLRWGDVWIDGRPVTKSLSEQRALRVLIHEENAGDKRWRAGSNSQWHEKDGCWEIDAIGGVEPQWLRYHHPHEQLLTDAFDYNAGLTRQLNLVRDVMLCGYVRASGEGDLFLEINAGQETCRIALSPSSAELFVQLDDGVAEESQLPSKIVNRLASGGALLEFSNFNGQILLAIDGETLLEFPWIPTSAPQGTARPVSLGSSDLQVTVNKLCLYRDIYYSRQAVGLADEPKNLLVQIQPGQYYLLGDNSPISVDSRSWGPVSEGLFVGRPLALGDREPY